MEKMNVQVQWDPYDLDKLLKTPDIDVIEVPYQGTSNLLRYAIPDGHADYEHGGWQADIYNLTIKESGKKVIIAAGIGHLGNIRPSSKLIAEFESRAAQVNARLIRYGEKAQLVNTLLDSFIEEALIDGKLYIEHIKKMRKLKEEHDRKQWEIENWENNH